MTNPPSVLPSGPGAQSQEIPRRDFLKASAFAAVAMGGAFLPKDASASQGNSQAAATSAAAKKTFLAVGGHLDDVEIGIGGLMIQAARAGHRVVVVTVAGDLSSWPPTEGREERTKRELQELAEKFGYEKRYLDGKYHQTVGTDLNLKRKLAEIYVELKPEVAFIQHYEDHWPDHAQSGIAAKDAFLFSPAYTRDKQEHREVLIYGFDVTPIQTYHFEPDVFYDISDVMPEYMDLIARIQAIRARPLSEVLRYQFQSKDGGGQTLHLSHDGLNRFADIVRFGGRSSCRYALGLRTVWGEQRGGKIV